MELLIKLTGDELKYGAGLNTSNTELVAWIQDLKNVYFWKSITFRDEEKFLHFKTTSSKINFKKLTQLLANCKMRQFSGMGENGNDDREKEGGDGSKVHHFVQIFAHDEKKVG